MTHDSSTTRWKNLLKGMLVWSSHLLTKRSISLPETNKTTALTFHRNSVMLFTRYASRNAQLHQNACARTNISAKQTICERWFINCIFDEETGGVPWSDYKNNVRKVVYVLIIPKRMYSFNTTSDICFGYIILKVVCIWNPLDDRIREMWLFFEKCFQSS